MRLAELDRLLVAGRDAGVDGESVIMRLRPLKLMQCYLQPRHSRRRIGSWCV